MNILTGYINQAEKKIRIKKHAKLQKFMQIVCKILCLHAVNVLLQGENLQSYQRNRLVC